jgi:glutathione S-transferase
VLTVHHLDNSRSQRILWLLEELGLDYEMRRYARNPLTKFAPPQLRAIHPLGKAPVITDGGNTVAESGAIIEYLLERYGNGRLIPAPGSPERLRYTYWLHFAEGSAMPPLLMQLVFDKIETAPMPFFVKPIARAISRNVKTVLIAPNLERHLTFMEEALGASEWFAGAQFTAADIQMSFPVEASRGRAGLDGTRPRLMHFLERIHARPAYQRALAKGGPFSLNF